MLWSDADARLQQQESLLRESEVQYLTRPQAARRAAPLAQVKARLHRWVALFAEPLEEPDCLLCR